MPVRADEFSAAYSTAFDSDGPVNEFAAAFSAAFDPPATGEPTRFVITGANLLTSGYRLALIQADGTLVVVTTVTARTATRIECTWQFTVPGTYWFVLVNTGGLIASDRLPVVVSRG